MKTPTLLDKANEKIKALRTQIKDLRTQVKTQKEKHIEDTQILTCHMDDARTELRNYVLEADAEIAKTKEECDAAIRKMQTQVSELNVRTNDMASSTYKIARELQDTVAAFATYRKNAESLLAQQQEEINTLTPLKGFRITSAQLEKRK